MTTALEAGEWLAARPEGPQISVANVRELVARAARSMVYVHRYKS